MRRALKAGAAVASIAGLAACSGLDLSLPGGSAPNPAPAASPGYQVLPPDPLIGKWGVASYRDEKDRARTAKMAHVQCSQAYVITKGPTDGVMMYVADDPKRYELELKKGADGKTYIGFNAPPGDPQDREVLELTSKEMVMRFVDPDTNQRYGTFVCEVLKMGWFGRKRVWGFALAAGLAACLLGFAPARAGSADQVTMEIDEEPGRVSTAEVVIEDGPFARQLVYYRASEAPGSLVINTQERFIYFILPNNRALRYGIGVGREGFQWSGLVKIARKAEWPDWTPPPEMIQRQPYLPRFMAGGPGNPLGARAMYLGATVYRIHGTNQPETIGQAVSSGCFRLANGDVIDLYSRVEVGAKVFIRQAAQL